MGSSKMPLKFTKQFEKRMKQIDYLSQLTLMFGVVDTRKKLNGVLVIKYMSINEYGTKDKRIPPRPFFRKVLFQQRVQIRNFVRKEFANVANGDKTAMNAMKSIGDYLKAAVESSILNGSYIPNAPATVSAKKSDKPLIDTRTGLNAVGYRIYKGNKILFKKIGNER